MVIYNEPNYHTLLKSLDHLLYSSLLLTYYLVFSKLKSFKLICEFYLAKSAPVNSNTLSEDTSKLFLKVPASEVRKSQFVNPKQSKNEEFLAFYCAFLLSEIN